MTRNPTSTTPMIGNSAPITEGSTVRDRVWAIGIRSAAALLMILRSEKRTRLNAVLLVTDLFPPVDDLAIVRLCDGDVAHGGVRRGAMPVLFTRREPDDIAGADLLDRTAVALHPAAAESDDQRLSEWMRVPSGARTRLERYRGTADARWRGRLKRRVEPHGADEVFGWAFRRGLRAVSFDIHQSVSFVATHAAATAALLSCPLIWRSDALSISR